MKHITMMAPASSEAFILAFKFISTFHTPSL